MSTRTLTIGNVTFGEGRSKICAPMVGNTFSDLKKELRDFWRVPFDLVEWRVDFFKDVHNPGQVMETLWLLKKELEDIPLMFTFRTTNEGGKTPMDPDKYVALTREIAASGMAQFVDIELSAGADAIGEVSKAAHDTGTHVILSHHNFERTYARTEIVEKYQEMLSYDVDVSKMALMPQTMKDVFSLMGASAEMLEKHPERLVIAISMGKLGILTRTNAELVGSILTFGAASGSSAPGQINTVDLLSALEITHKTSA